MHTENTTTTTNSNTIADARRAYEDAVRAENAKIAMRVAEKQRAADAEQAKRQAEITKNDPPMPPPSEEEQKIAAKMRRIEALLTPGREIPSLAAKHAQLSAELHVEETLRMLEHEAAVKLARLPNTSEGRVMRTGMQSATDVLLCRGRNRTNPQACWGVRLTDGGRPVDLFWATGFTFGVLTADEYEALAPTLDEQRADMKRRGEAPDAAVGFALVGEERYDVRKIAARLAGPAVDADTAVSSLLAGITDPHVLAMWMAHCEKTGDEIRPLERRIRNMHADVAAAFDVAFAFWSRHFADASVKVNEKTNGDAA